MKTVLKPGTYFRFRYRGRWDYAKVAPNGTTYNLIGEDEVPVGEAVHSCVWLHKGDVLESRKIIKHVHVPCDPDDCMLIQWERKKPPVDDQGNPVCPRCGAPAEMVLGVIGNPCWAHKVLTKE